MSKIEKFSLATLIVASNTYDLGDNIVFLSIMLIAISFIITDGK